MNAKPYTIGVLTSGGDAPGMNAAIRSVVRTAFANNIKVLGIANGYEGLVNGEFRPLGARDVMVGLTGMGITSVGLEEVTSHSRSAALADYEMSKMLAR